MFTRQKSRRLLILCRFLFYVLIIHIFLEKSNRKLEYNAIKKIKFCGGAEYLNSKNVKIFYMEKIAFYDAKNYDKESFDAANRKRYSIKYIEAKLTGETAVLSRGCRAACAFVNDEINAETIDGLVSCGVEIIAMRSAGYSNVDLEYAAGKIKIVHVPAYSPHAVAEHAAALLLSLVRKIHKAYIRTREFNFNISGLTGEDLYGKTVGVIGTGKIGRAFINICLGLGMRVVASDPYPTDMDDVEYTSIEKLLRESDVISLHCPLTKENYRLIGADAISAMKDGVYILNTSRGGLIDSAALIDGLNCGKIAGAALDVYEEEGDLFFNDNSDKILRDDVLALLISKPNVLLTSHQAFLTRGALKSIAETTLLNLDRYFSSRPLENEISAK